MMDTDPRTDAELLAATPREKDAFAVFYGRHVRDVLAFVARRAQAHEVGDLVAEVFATALVHRRRYDPARGEAGAWLIGIAVNKLADARRRCAVEVRLCRRLGMTVPELAAPPEAEAVAAELMAGLPSDQRRAVEARIVNDQSYAAIARAESVSEQAIRKRVSRALSTLRARLQEQP